MRVPTHPGTESRRDEYDDGEGAERQEELELNGAEKHFDSPKGEKGQAAVCAAVGRFLLRRRVEAVDSIGGGVANRNDGGHGSPNMRRMLRRDCDCDVEIGRAHV